MKKITFTIIFVVFIIFAFYSYSSAQTAEELQTQISNTNSQIEKINNQIKILSSQIVETGQQKNTLANAIKDLTLRRDKLIKEREQTEKKITATGLIIKSLNNDISDKNESLNKSKNYLSSLLKNLYHLPPP